MHTDFERNHKTDYTRIKQICNRFYWERSPVTQKLLGTGPNCPSGGYAPGVRGLNVKNSLGTIEEYFASSFLSKKDTAEIQYHRIQYVQAHRKIYFVTECGELKS